MSNLLEFLIPDPKERAAEQGRARLRVHVTERLLVELERAGMSKADLAKKAGVSRAAVTQALSGTRNMTLNALYDYAAVLGLEPVVEFVVHQAFESTEPSAAVGASAQTFTVGPAVPLGQRVPQFGGTAATGVLVNTQIAQQWAPVGIELRR